MGYVKDIGIVAVGVTVVLLGASAIRRQWPTSTAAKWLS